MIGGYTVGGRTFDALIFGYYLAGKLIYAARTRNGFTPALRENLMKRFSGLETANQNGIISLNGMASRATAAV